MKKKGTGRRSPRKEDLEINLGGFDESMLLKPFEMLPSIGGAILSSALFLGILYYAHKHAQPYVEQKPTITISAPAQISGLESKIAKDVESEHEVTYIVKPGDTLSSIRDFYIDQGYKDVTAREIKSYNNLINSRSIQPGQELRIHLH